ncbi:N-acetyl-gamma-glutamyl-phosphate reductase [Campylobacter geochelonis]|uniref:N-acetyl-gamma-glutamyl-phosphate reductase n=1 Tax=Campylobacter geochelonis TaxID=1780362 RepID=UPI0007709BB1|nr:N-acetyl-gamma-glutamyl-phosphate reductase [Campylobacter geochelonis]CZE46715.1 N-acetyl-gamma-glutamyl-phosphate reductase [Campylobacter geochelonis]
MKRVGIIGVSGYTGVELVKILLNHPEFELSYLAATSEGKIDEIFPQLSGVCELKVEVANAKTASLRCDLVFLALPHEKAMEFASEILSFGTTKVVDLSADYRLSLELYEKNYTTHQDKKNLASAVYGLPELHRKRIKTTNLVANPGCYPTCSILAILPFLPFLDTKFGVMIDAKSGVSGAGKSLKQTSHFVNVNENINAYSPLSHRHADEIKEQISLAKKEPISTLFVPHLVPLTRGMLVSVFGVLNEKIDELEVLREFYKDEKFVRVRNEPVQVKNVVGTNFCDIFVKKLDGKIWINSAIDNLLRGASSQAVVNANLMCGFDEGLGIPNLAYGI